MQLIAVTGINGFVGLHLARALKDRGVSVLGIGQEAAPHPSLSTVITNYSQCDLTDPTAVAALPLADVNSVISLAGLARVADSFSQADLYKRVNVQVLSVLCEELLKKQLVPRVVAISTGAVYAQGQPMPLTESSLLIKDGSPYAMSKILMEEAAQKYASRGLPCVIARPFNHIGPGQEQGFILPDLYAQLRRAMDRHEPIKVGDLSTRRDYTDVRDVVQAYCDLALAPKLESLVYNVCSGKSLSGQEILAALKEELAGSEKVTITPDPLLLRNDDPKELLGSHQLITRETGWVPKISLKQTISDFVKQQAA